MKTLKSMTAYGRAICQSTLGSITVEIQSVNRKFLEVHLNLPRDLRRFEMDIRKKLSEEILCGHVYINISARFQKSNPLCVTPNLPLARELYRAWSEIAGSLDLDFSSQFKLSMLAHEDAILNYEADLAHDDEYRTQLLQAVEEALLKFNQMAFFEGEVLQRDLLERILKLKSLMEKVSSKVHNAPNRYREKLSKKMEELLPGAVENEERVLRELVIYCEKVDVSEEITRFNSHIEQLKNHLGGGTRGVGKAIDFVVQELNREVNTLGAKSPDLEVTQLVVEIKTELAKIREQIQNIE